MEELKFRDLRPEEIEVRVGNLLKDKDNQPYAFNLMLYKTARTDMALLDECVGAFNWQKKYYQVKNTMVCSIGIFNEKRMEWLWKDDGGDDDTTMEQVKSELSDSFKRAGFSWGIGRKLYSASKIYMVVNISETNNPKKSYYQVKEIEYDDTSITKLVIINKKTKEVVISYPSNAKVSQTSEKPQKKDILAEATQGIGDDFLEESGISSETKDKITAITGKLSADRYASFKNYLQGTFNVSSIGELTEKQGKQLLGILGGK